jgi:hypothetical protein
MTMNLSRRAVCFAPLLLGACTTTPNQADKGLLGTWDVSLNFDPSQPPSKTEMIISAITKNRLQGTFYGSAFVTSTISRKDGRSIYMAKTTDQSSEYFHEWRMQPKGALIGKTVSPQRKFEMTWTAEKKKI